VSDTKNGSVSDSMFVGRKMGKPNSYTAYTFTIIGTLLPTCYIWLLPFLSGFGYAE